VVDDASMNGTELAKGPSVETSPFRVIRAANLRALANEWVRLRPFRMLPSHLITLSMLLLAGFPRERVAIVGGFYALNSAHLVIHALRARRTGIHERTLFHSHLLLLTLQSCVVAATGAMHSPLWPALLGASLGTLNLFGRSRESWITVSYTSALAVILALLPASIAGPPLAEPWHTALGCWTILFTLFLLRTSTFGFSDAYRATEEQLDRLREEVIQASDQRARSLECISSKVAHELKNPLSAIKGLAQLLGRGASDPRSRERLEVISAEVMRMEVILRDYLSFSRPLDDLRSQPLELGALADEVLAVLEARAEVAAVSLKRSGGGARAVGDPRRLKEALLNLIANAIEATRQGGEVEVSVLGGADEATIEIRDTGRGLGAEELARIGTPFYTTREDGTGLGVVLARGVIKQHGGQVAYESEVGKGTRVKVTLPAHAPEGRPKASAPTAAPAAEVRAHG
jgi:signal transduction histidine kinase